MTRPAVRLLSAALAAFALSPAPVRAQEPPTGAAPSQEQAAQIDSTSQACQPAYPVASLKAGVTGTTVVRLAITAVGQITRIDVVRVSGPTLEHRLLDYAFEQALAKCPYFPGRDWQGRVVGGTLTVTHAWQLPAATAR
jgi:outer membrane biosynthesis protein TonB